MVLVLARSASEGFRENVPNRVEQLELQEFLGNPSLALRANKSGNPVEWIPLLTLRAN